jgi:adenylosuccinate synthase
MSVDVVLGGHRGDEGKGRYVDILAADHDIAARFNGGSNAGHTVVLPDGRELALHQIPSGIPHPNVVNVIGNGVLVDVIKLNTEIENIRAKGIAVTPGNLKISSAAHLILPHHICADGIREAGAGKQGSTKSGIAQAAAEKAMRTNLRAEDIFYQPKNLFRFVYAGLKAQQEDRERAGLEKVDPLDITVEYCDQAAKLGEYVTDTVMYLNGALSGKKPKRILAEGAQAFLLDIDHGMYPFVTSSTTTAGGVASGLGIPARLDRVTAVVKAIQSHVGEGPFVTEITEEGNEELLERLHGDMSKVDAEKGTTTGRIRRLGHLDLPQLKRACIVNGVTDLALSKLDWVSRYENKIPVCVGYELNNNYYNTAPDSAILLDASTPVYEYLPNWSEDISEVRSFKKLPKNAKNYIRFIRDHIDVDVSLIGVGPRRDEVISRSSLSRKLDQFNVVRM